MDRNSIPKATLGRLPLYLHYLSGMQGAKNVSATAIAKGLSLGEVQVRKDLAMVSGAGRPKIGYVTADLIRIIELCLGGSKTTKAVLVGAGKLGQALLLYEGFSEYGVTISAAFDLSERTLGNKKILPIDSLNEYCKKNEIKLGIITVGKDAAQEVCDRMIQSGVAAIWNFAPCRLSVPAGTIVKQENLALSLAHLSNQLENKKQEN